MRIIFICLLFLILSCGKSTIDCLELSYKGGVTYHKGKVFTGTCITTHENDSLRSVQNYTNGLDDGNWTFYFSNGKAQTKGQFVNGKRIGKWSYFFENGNKKQISTYSNGLKTGIWYGFNQQGDTVWKKKFINDTLYYNLPTK